MTKVTKIILFILCASFVLCYCANDSTIEISNTQREDFSTVVGDTNVKVEQKAITDGGYGRKTYYAGEISFEVGCILQKFIDDGFNVRNVEEKVPAWGFSEVLAYYNCGIDGKKRESIRLYMLNESDTIQSAKDCRVVFVRGDLGIKQIDCFEVGVTTRNEILSKYDVSELLIDKQLIAMPYDENDLGYGTVFNNIRFRFDKESVLEEVQILYYDNIFSEIEVFDKTTIRQGVSMMEISMLKSYYDFTEFFETDCFFHSVNLNEKFNTDVLKITLNGIVICFGNNTENYYTLVDKGIEFLINEEKDSPSYFEAVGFRSSHGMSRGDNGILKICDRVVNGIILANYYSEESVGWKDATLEGITVENPLGVCTNKNSVTFDFYGVTEKSNIKDVFEKLGVPYQMYSSSDAPHLVEMSYNFATKDQGIRININVDTLNNSIYDIDVAVFH